MAVSKSKKRKKKPSKRRPADPWDVLVHSHDLFLRELECVAEMYELVLPVLKERDKVRDARINELMDKIKTARGRLSRVTSYRHSRIRRTYRQSPPRRPNVPSRDHNVYHLKI